MTPTKQLTKLAAGYHSWALFFQWKNYRCRHRKDITVMCFTGLGCEKCGRRVVAFLTLLLQSVLVSVVHGRVLHSHLCVLEFSPSHLVHELLLVILLVRKRTTVRNGLSCHLGDGSPPTLTFSKSGKVLFKRNFIVWNNFTWLLHDENV